ncbi:MAG: hypothetical protein CME66_06215 [Halobacteriovoraceae bacterium]|nr:hypothetical protein [Halobacteriovoraceae bacterium]|tara:strand:+ start:401 stop:751 length:351 start_codon:yes stop_codon:yes gene_type:complete
MKKKWTKEKLAKEAKKYTTRSEFKNSSPSAYVIARKSGLLDKVCSHMPRPKINKKNHWTKERILKEAKKYSTKKEFNEKCSAAYSAAGKLKIRDEACAHMDSNLWTKETMYESSIA